MNKLPLWANLLTLIFSYVTTLFLSHKTILANSIPVELNSINELWGEVSEIYQESSKSSLIVNITNHNNKLIREGALLEAVRFSHNKYVKTAKLKVIRLTDNGVVSEVIQNGTWESKIHLEDYPLIMKKDKIQLAALKIRSKISLSPVSGGQFKELFLDPKPVPESYELSEQGKLKIEKDVSVYKDLQQSFLIIEAHTDSFGNWHINQMESIERAKVIKSYLVSNLGFSSDRVIAIGLGEMELKDDSYVKGYKDNNRRIVFRLKPSEMAH